MGRFTAENLSSSRGKQFQQGPGEASVERVGAGGDQFCGGEMAAVDVECSMGIGVVVEEDLEQFRCVQGNLLAVHGEPIGGEVMEQGGLVAK